jgi:hypothetical protein
MLSIIVIYIFSMVHTNSLPHGLSHKKHYSQVVFPVNNDIITFQQFKCVSCKQA